MPISNLTKGAIAGLMLLAALPASAAQIVDCDWAASAQSLVEPWDKHTKVFLNGAVRIALINTGGEPVCCSTQLLILAENKSEPEAGRVCKLLRNDKDLGYEWIEFDKIKASYHPALGLDLTVPFKIYVDGLKDRRGVARVNIKTQNGVITAR